MGREQIQNKGLGPHGTQQSSMSDESFAPSSESLLAVSRFGASAELLDLDTHGFLAQLLQVADKSTERAPLYEELLRISHSLLQKLEQQGLSRNPDVEVVLKDLYSPRLLREAISHLLRDPADHASLVPVVAICFIAHPSAALRECRFLGRQLYRTPGQRTLWSSVADGLVTACTVMPELWTALEPSQRRWLKGPDFLGERFKSCPYSELIRLPSFVVESAFAQTNPPESAHAQRLLTSLIYSPGSILDKPGLLPIVRRLRKASGPLPEDVVSQLVQNVRGALMSHLDGSDVARWTRAHRSGELRRSDGHAESILKGFLAEVLSFEEIRAQLSKLGTDPDGIIAAMRLRRSESFVQARDLMLHIIRKDSSFHDEDARKLVSALECYSDEGLERCIRTGGTLIAKGAVPIPGDSGVELAMRYACLGPDKGHHLTEAFALFKVSADPAYEVCIRVACRALPREELAMLLEGLVQGDLTDAVVRAWENIPPGHDTLLFRVLWKHSMQLGVDMPEVAAGCMRWSSMSDFDIRTIFREDVEQIRTPTRGSSYACVLLALSKITISDPEFIAWRTSILNQIMVAHANDLVSTPEQKALLLSLLYEGTLMQDLARSPLAEGVRTHVCSLKLSTAEVGQLDPVCRKVLGQVNQWMNGAFSDYALERGLFTKASALLGRYGQTRRTLRDMRLEVKQSLRAEPSSKAAHKLLNTIEAFERARRGGRSLERLRRKLAFRGLLRYQEQEVPVLAATETYLRRYGLELDRSQRHPQETFPPLMILKAALNQRYNIGRTAQRDSHGRRVMRGSPEDLAQLLLQCRKALQVELTVPQPYSFLRLLTIPAERRAFSAVLGKVLLGVSLFVGVGAVGSAFSSWQRSLVNRDAKGLSGRENPIKDMTPNGSIPTVERPLAHLSHPLLSWRNSYLVCGLIGANAAKATQPPLLYEGSPRVWSWLEFNEDERVWESGYLTLNSVSQDDFVGVPIGAALFDPTFSIERFPLPVRATRDARDLQIDVRVPVDPPVDTQAMAADLRERIGILHTPLWKPRLPFSTVREVSPDLADAIDQARAMPAAEAAAYLESKVSTLFKYEHTPEYDNFEGTFEEYFRLIVQKRQGICGQFAVVFDEALKQAGIPSCIARVYVPEEDGVTYTTRGAHATNIVFLMSPTQKPLPKIFDATGIGASPPATVAGDSITFNDLVLPAGVVGGLSLTALLALRRQQRRRDRLEEEALASARDNNDQPPEEMTENQEASDGEAAQRLSMISPEIMLSRWVLYHLQKRDHVTAGRRDTGGIFDLDDFDIEPALKAADAMRASLFAVEPITLTLLERTGLPHQEVLAGILNAWYRGMQDSNYRREWCTHLQRRDLFSSVEATALVHLACELLPDMKYDGDARALLPRWNPFYRRAPLDAACLLRAFTPLGKNEDIVG